LNVGFLAHEGYKEFLAPIEKPKNPSSYFEKDFDCLYYGTQFNKISNVIIS